MLHILITSFAAKKMLKKFDYHFYKKNLKYVRKIITHVSKSGRSACVFLDISYEEIFTY